MKYVLNFKFIKIILKFGLNLIDRTTHNIYEYHILIFKTHYIKEAKRMKYIISLLIVLSLTLVFAGCGGTVARDMERGYSSVKDSIENGMDDNAFNNQNDMNGNDNRTYTSDYSSSSYMNSDNINSNDLDSNNMTSHWDNGSNARIDREEAKKIALGHAKVNESDIRDFEIELDKDNGTYKYNVSFEAGNIEYEYDVNANTGEIMESSKEEKHTNSMR